MTLRCIFMAGPTAVGKTSFSLALAAAVDGVIINADSMQIYDVMQVVSARPDTVEMGYVPHRLFGTVDPSCAYSVADWQAAALAEAEDAWENGMTPVFVGGTGMYFSALLTGLSAIPDISPEVRDRVRKRALAEGSEVLHAELTTVDPVTAERLFPGDSQRICRALEVYLDTGKPLSLWHQETVPGPLAEMDAAGQVLKIVLQRPRDQLYDRINQRFAQMFEEGAVEEVKALIDLGLDRSLPAMKALGVPSIRAYIEGEMDKASAIADAAKQTRRFAKRQLTWFRQQFSDWHHIDVSTDDAAEKLSQIIDGFIAKG